ncbi:MAG: hypothetical protein KBS56_04900, partial [Clostridiales bacterium]|nr:hypothetical protein [Candidatus Crickella equi]
AFNCVFSVIFLALKLGIFIVGLLISPPTKYGEPLRPSLPVTNTVPVRIGLRGTLDVSRETFCNMQVVLPVARTLDGGGLAAVGT